MFDLVDDGTFSSTPFVFVTLNVTVTFGSSFCERSTLEGTTVTAVVTFLSAKIPERDIGSVTIFSILFSWLWGPSSLISLGSTITAASEMPGGGLSFNWVST